MVPRVGFEPTRDYSQRILSLLTKLKSDRAKYDPSLFLGSRWLEEEANISPTDFQLGYKSFKSEVYAGAPNC